MLDSTYNSLLISEVVVGVFVGVLLLLFLLLLFVVVVCLFFWGVVCDLCVCLCVCACVRASLTCA